jgi:hypothetical protein
LEKKESAACFWVAACKAFYGTSMINYWELKINILDLMRRYIDLHPTNKWKINAHEGFCCFYTKSGRGSKMGKNTPVSFELRRFGSDMDDNHYATSIAQQLVSNQILIPSFRCDTRLLVFTVLVRKKDSKIAKSQCLQKQL